MKKIILSLLCSSALFGAGFRLNSATSNIPASPSTAAGSLVLTGIAGSKHIKICSEATTRIRYSYSTNSATTAPASATDYDGIIPAASSGSFVCETKDGIALKNSLYIWSDSGSAISSGLVYGDAW